MTDTDKKIIEDFSNAVPEGVSTSDLARGMDITFTHDGQEYTINTKLEGYAKGTIEDYFKIIRQRAIDAVNLDEQETGICNGCGSELAPIYEDRHPDGIGYNEIVGYKPCAECKYIEE